MTVLFPPQIKRACEGSSPNGRFGYIQLLLQFGCDWYIDLPVVRGRISALASGDDFAFLLRDIITGDLRAGAWAVHPNARAILRAAYEHCAQAWEGYLRFEPDRDQQALEYLAEHLRRFKAATA